MNSERKSHRRGNGVLLTTEELATKLGEEPRTVLTLRKKGIIPHVDLGYRLKRFRLDDVLNALSRRTVKAR
jgi:helix-turn-helix protein